MTVAIGSNSKAPVGAIWRLADWLVTLRHEHIPPAVRQVAGNCLLDTIGVAIAGAATKVAQSAREVVAESGSQGVCSILGRPQTCGTAAAAFLNGSAAHALDFDDNCYAGFVHGSAVIAPAALALAQQLDLSGSDLLTAFIAGSECEYAVGSASNSVLYQRGWWSSSVLGPLGAAAAACWLLRLERHQTAAALGLAVAASGGLKACFGSDGKALMAGRAAEAGVTAALLAKHGASGPADAIEHENGFVRLFNQGTFDATALERLGQHWFMLDPGIDIKRIPVCLSSHAAVDAAGWLLTQHGIAPGQIEEIICDVPPVVQANLIYQRPMNRQQAQFSLPFAIAVALLYGSVELHHLDQAVLDDAAVIALMQRVQMVSGARWQLAGACQAAPEGASVSIKARGRAAVECFQPFARGAASCPLTPAELEHKFLACLKAGNASHMAALLPRLQSLESVAKVRGLFLL